MVVYVNNVHITVVHRRIRDHRGGNGSFFAKGKQVFYNHHQSVFLYGNDKKSKVGMYGNDVRLRRPGGLRSPPSRARPRLLPGSRSLHSQVCRVCRFCATSVFFPFFRSHLLFVGREGSGGTAAAGGR